MPRQTAARVLAISPRSFQRLEAAGVLTPATPGKGSSPGLYDLTVTVSAYLRHLARERPEPAKDRRDRSQAELNELRLKERRGELVEAAAVEASWGRHVLSARNQLLAIPSRLAASRPSLSRDDLAAVDAAIRGALEELADGRKDGAPV